MRDPFDDAARRRLFASLADDEVTPVQKRPPRGCARRGSVVVALDTVSGSFVGSDVPTPDPPDLAKRRPKWAGAFKVLKEV